MANAGRPPKAPPVEPNLPEEQTVDAALAAENALLKKRLAEQDRKFAELEKKIAAGGVKASSVALYCAADLSHGITLTIVYDNGKKVVFDKPFQRKTMTVDEFKSFASSLQGSYHLESRNVIVGDDVPDEIAEAWDVQYRPGELLKRDAMNGLLGLSAKELTEMYDALCSPHKRIVARRLADGYHNGDKRVTKEKVKALGENLRSVLKDMAEKEAATL